MSPEYSSEDKAFLKNIGLKIRHLRQKANISQEELADLARLDRSYLGSVERGERNISVLNLKKIADALETHSSKLFSPSK
jgi:transcriptional regulator with XRE-family HTH domain